MPHMKHYPGYNEAQSNVSRMNRAQLIDAIETLFGFDHLIEVLRIPVAQMDDITLRAEVSRQIEIDWRDSCQ